MPWGALVAGIVDLGFMLVLIAHREPCVAHVESNTCIVPETIPPPPKQTVHTASTLGLLSENNHNDSDLVVSHGAKFFATGAMNNFFGTQLVYVARINT